MKAAMLALILSAALLAAVMLARPDWLTPDSQPKASAARPWVKGVYPADPRVALVARRKAVKEELARSLFDGELTLLEAAERFRVLDGDLPAVKAMPGERLCNLAISWAAAVMQNDRPQHEVAARVAVLRRELQDHVARHGGVLLPAVEAE
jgi:hypothetical protein